MPLVSLGWRAWQAVWDFDAPGPLMHRLRVGIGLMWVWLYCTLFQNATILYDAEIGLDPKQMQSVLGGARLDWFDHLNGQQVQVLLVSGLFASCMFTLGLLPRLAAVVMYGIHLGLQYRCYTWMDGSDDLLRCMLFYLMLVPWRRGARVYPGWPLRLVQLQLAIMYLATAVFKARGRDWWDGTALYWGLSDPRWQRFPTDHLVATAAGQTVLQWATWSTLGLEFALPVLLLWPRTRKPAVVLGVGLHLGIWLLMRVGLFSPAVMACYLAFWELPSDRPRQERPRG